MREFAGAGEANRNRVVIWLWQVLFQYLLELLLFLQAGCFWLSQMHVWSTK